MDTTRLRRKRKIKEHPETKIERKKREQQVSNTAGGRWRQQRRTELDGEKRSVAYVPPAATRQFVYCVL